MIGPLKAARERGAAVRLVPFGELANAVGATTTLVVCSHVGWVSGELAPAELAQVDVPVLLDGAQGSGAVPVDVTALNCAAYAAAGQKWLCGADGTGMLYVSPRWRDRIRPIAPELHLLRGHHARARVALQGRRPPLRHAVALARGRRALARRARGARAPRLRRRPRPRPRAGRRARPPPRRRPATPSPRAATARSSPGRTRTPRPRATACATRGSSCATSPAARSCAPPSAPGTTTPTSTACSPRSSPTRAPGAASARPRPDAPA